MHSLDLSATPLFQSFLQILQIAPSTNPLSLSILCLFGLALGSFLNVVIHRGAKNLSVHFPERSFCPQCHTQLGWAENIPLLSYTLQHGRCKHCKQPISPIYPIVELSFGILTPLLWAQSLSLQEFLINLTFVSTAIPAGLIDIQTFRLPDHLTLGGTLAIITLCLPTPDLLAQTTTGALGAFLVMAGFYALGKSLFKNKKTTLVTPAPTRWVRSETEAFLQLAEENETLESTEKIYSHELFDHSNPEGDTLVLEGAYHYSTPEQTNPISCTKIRLSPTDTEILDRQEKIPFLHLEGTTKSLSHPSPPMGWGDVKLMALCGATLGVWDAFQGLTLAAAGGLVFLCTLRIIAKVQKKPLPDILAFGPWIVAGTLGFLLLK